MADLSKEEVFKHVVITEDHVSFSEAGAVRIHVSLSLKGKISNLGDIRNPVVDGTIKADVYQERKIVGSAMLVLPIYGIGFNESIIVKGICLSGVDVHKPYKIKYKPYKLWIMEQ